MTDPAQKIVSSFEEDGSDQHGDSGASNEGYGANHNANVPAGAGQGVSSGLISVMLHHNRESRREEHHQGLLLEGGDENDYPVPHHVIRWAEDESGGTFKKATKKRSSQKKAPSAPAAKRKRKPAEDPKTYVPLAIREHKSNDFYWYTF